MKESLSIHTEKHTTPELNDKPSSNRTESIVPLEMYEVSGYQEIDDRALNRYSRDKAQDEAIKSSVHRYPYKDEKYTGPDTAQKIEEVLDHGDASHIIGAILEISPAEVSPEQFLTLKQKAEETITRLLTEGSFETQVYTADKIRYFHNLDRVELYKAALKNPNPAVQMTAAHKMFVIFPKHAKEIGEEILNNAGIYDKARSLIFSEWQASLSFSYPDKSRWKDLLLKGLESSFTDIQVEAARIIRLTLIGDEGKTDDTKTFSNEEAARLNTTIKKHAEDGLSQSDMCEQKEASKMIKYCKASEQAELEEKLLEVITLGLNNPDMEIKKTAIRMISNIPSHAVRVSTFNKVKAQGLGQIAIEAPLYSEDADVASSFKRINFPKTGSSLTAFEGSLKNKSVTRHITPQAFLAWQKLYEDHTLWRRRGFEYVPIEPIQSFTLRTNPEIGEPVIDVQTAVLDINLSDWTALTNSFNTELGYEVEKIRSAVEAAEVSHGHTHDENFCLRFFRDEQGQPDFTRQPRLYLIDFDEAYVHTPFPDSE